MESYYTCSECGRRFCIGTSVSKYMYCDSSYISGTETNVKYQCSYTCYNHSRLRKETIRKKNFPENFKKDVIKCEVSMKSQGKEIINPINC